MTKDTAPARPGVEKLTDGELKWLRRLADKGTWPDGPFLRDAENSLPLMRKGLVEVIAPRAPYLAYAAITPAGRQALDQKP